jgi:hypothetical protein
MGNKEEEIRLELQERSVGLEVRGVHGWTTHAITTTTKIS